jgi:hypothetical protein
MNPKLLRMPTTLKIVIGWGALLGLGQMGEWHLN